MSTPIVIMSTPTNGQGKRFTCDLCVFWEPGNDPYGSRGDCRVAAPIYVAPRPWPRTLRDDWCAQGRVDQEKWDKR